jgi:stearoyl-CoA desaturase (delta-9 desaturase)
MLRRSALGYLLAACAVWWTCGWAFVAPNAQNSGRGIGRQRSNGGFAGNIGNFFTGSQVSSTDAAYTPWSWGRLSMGIFATALAAAAADKQKKRPLRDMKAPDNADAVREERAKGVKKVKGGNILQRFFSVRYRQFWDYAVFPRTYWKREWEPKDFLYAAVFGIVHFGACFAPFYFTWKAFACFFVGYVITGMLGITLSYHRQLAHLSFKSPKIVEYFLAYCGALALQSHPINWVSGHRHHHGATDTPNDVHSPKDGFWWSHAGWLLDQKGTWMRVDKSNAEDLSKQWFYRFLQSTYPLHAIVMPIAALYYFGGLPCVFWGFFARVVWVWHITWAVNSVCHVWGFKDWNTSDISMNNWLLGILAFGEGWHNNHHAFETSCRHGLKWWQIDMTWYTVKVLEFFGLANSLKYPSEAKMRKLTFPKVRDVTASSSSADEASPASSSSVDGAAPAVA